MNEIMKFEGCNVEVIEVEGKVLFNAKNVGEVLDMSDVTVRRHIQGMTDKQVVKLKNSNVQDMNFRKLHNTGENFLTEAGVYKLAFRSNKPSAEKFTNWVAEEVLPTIRKHGMYAKDELLDNPDLLLSVVTKLKEEREQKELALKEKEKLEREKLILEPKANYCDDILISTDSLTITQIAQDYGMSARKLNSILKDLKIQYKNNGQWILYADYKDKGYIDTDTIVLDNGKTVIHTKWTQKGRMFLYEILKANGYTPVKELN